MPHNRTRMWVGLAIAAVTIPAVGQYYYSAQNNRLQTHPVVGSARWAASNGIGDTHGNGQLALRQTRRDYLAEVNGALGRGGSTYGSDLALVDAPLLQPSPLDDEPSELGPMDFGVEEGPIVPRGDGTAPDPADEMAPPLAIASIAQDEEDDDNPALDDAPAANGGLSDRAIYSLVVDGLNDEERDDFVRAWAIMTPDQRADLLDEFRANLDPAGSN